MILGGHVQHGFFFNWFGNQAGEGMEYFILIIGMALALVVGGAGKYINVSTYKVAIHTLMLS